MSITMNQRTFKVKLHQGEDLDRLAELRNAASAAKPVGVTTAMEDAEYAAAAMAYDEFLAEADTRAVTVELKPLLRKPYQDLVLAHPPRDDSDSDQAVGLNESTFAEPLVMACIVGPEMSDAEKTAFLDSLTFGQFDTLYQESFTINRTVFAPKGPLLGSAPSPKQDETSVSDDVSV